MKATLPNLTLDAGTDRAAIDAARISQQWIAALNQKLADGALDDAHDLFIDDCWWRDILGLAWDWSCKNGKSPIFQYLQASKQGFGNLAAVQNGGLQPQFVDRGVVQWIQSGFTFRNKFGHGRGFVCLINVAPNEWKAWVVLTVLEELDEPTQPKSHGQSEEPQVLVVGAGHSGLILGAHLNHLNLNYLIVDRNERIGDSWRKRYNTITSHTPSWMDHFPFLKFPKDYPEWLDQKHMSDWQEHYAQTLQLNVQLKTTVTDITYDNARHRYTVKVHGPDGERTFRPHHLVMATGLFTSIPNRPKVPKEKMYKGQTYHTIDHRSASDVSNVEEKRIVVIGAGTSAHDVAEDFVRHNAKGVTMIQRHPIFAVTRDSLKKVMLGPIFGNEHISLDEADLIANSFPLPVIRTMNVGQTHMMVGMDKELLEGMERAGMALKKGEDGVGLADYQFIKGGHFYIDQGACQMIADRRIKVHQCEEGVTEFYGDGVVLGDGTQLPAEVVVFATGHLRGDAVIDRMLGPKTRESVGDLGYLDDEQERIGWWRPTGVPGLWFMTGSFVWSRQFSGPLALQIKAIEDGNNPEYYTVPDTRSRKTTDSIRAEVRSLPTEVSATA